MRIRTSRFLALTTALAAALSAAACSSGGSEAKPGHLHEHRGECEP